MKVIICPRCRGVGDVVWDEGTHKSDDHYGKCTKCKGSGRLIEKIEITQEPFDPENAMATRLH